MKKTTKKTAETVLVLRTCFADMTINGGQDNFCRCPECGWQGKVGEAIGS